MINKLEHFFKINSKLPGIKSHIKLTPFNRRKTTRKETLDIARKSAVMILLWEKNDSIFSTLIQRPPYDGVHSNQMAFPGGKLEISDASLWETALRETKEEVGIDSSKIKFIGQLSELYIPPSNFIVYPFIGYMEKTPLYTLESNEVVEVIEFDIKMLLDENIVEKVEIELPNKMIIKTPAFRINGKIVWGATAAILSEFKDIIQSL